MASYQYIYVMKNLSKIYPGGREVLKDVTLSFFPGAKIGVIGPNGSGKSSILLAISVAFGQAYTEQSRKLSDLIRRGKDIATLRSE